MIDFMRRLRTQMQAQGKLTTMAVAAKASDIKTGWGGSYDYAALAPNVDFAVLMAYDYHYQGARIPGRSRRSAGCGRWRVSRRLHSVSGKVILGVPFYGFDWNTTKGPPARTVKMVEGPPLAAEAGRDERLQHDGRGQLGPLPTRMTRTTRRGTRTSAVSRRSSR